jgi:hypothetical protein
VLDIEAALAETGTTEYAPSPRVFRGEEEGLISAEETAALWGNEHWSSVALWSDELVLGD